jgi:hypothetical protein
MGRFAGGQLALLTAKTKGASTPSPGCEAREDRDTGVAVVVGFYPPTNLARLSSLGYLGGMEAFLRGYQDAVPERYRLLSPVSRVDPYDPLTFLVHGRDDRIVRVLGSVARVVTCTAAKYQYRSQIASCSIVLSARGVRVQGGYRTHCKRAST